MDTRNIAVIAHVDHGKTTLVDALLKQSHVFRDNEEEMQQEQILDRNTLERERGITILAKNCAITYKDTKINIIDTPGHADFSGEVERTLGMADGALLIVDAQEGPMPQTRFVLKKALDLSLKIIVIINKIDKKFADPTGTLSKIESLFLELAKDDSHLEFKTVYAIGRRGVVWSNLPSDLEEEGSVIPLLDAIIEYVPAAAKREGPFKMVVSSLEEDAHLGRIVVGRINRGVLKEGDKVVISRGSKTFKVERLMVYEGLNKVEVGKAESGEIVAIAGVPSARIGDTIADPSEPGALPAIEIAEPTLHIEIGPNTSPFAGREGKFVTGRQIEERLVRELEVNPSLRLERLDNGRFKISGRGELHLSILLETMRREGYEMEVGKPEVITKTAENGELVEPVEEVSVMIPKEYVGVINEEFGKRYAVLTRMEPTAHGEVEFVYKMPTRAILGLRSLLLTATKGTLIMNSVIVGYEPKGKELPTFRRGALIASQSGEALAYGLANAQERGIVFVSPGESVYEGMIVGINAKDEDILVNVAKAKKLTNMRSKSSDGVIQLTPATKLSLEQSLDFLEQDELLEITPHNLRLRKKFLTELERKRQKRA